MSAFRRTVRRSVVVAGTGIALLSAAPASRAFCDFVFKDVAEHAPVVVLVEYQEAKGEEPILRVVEVLKGESDRETLRLGPHGLKVYDPSNGSQFLLALTHDHTLVKSVMGMGACTPISVLALRRGKLRGSERSNYDGESKSMTLEQLRADLNGSTGSAS